MHAIRISGSHGSGKSTLLSDLVARFSWRELERMPIRTIDTTLVEKMRGNLMRHREEIVREIAAAESGNGTLLIQDRCICDWYAYLLAYHDIRMLSDSELTELQVEASAVMAGLPLPRFIVYICRPVTWVLSRLAARNDGRDAVRHAAYERGLTEAVSERFEEVMASVSTRDDAPNILRLRSTDRDESVTLVRNWILDTGCRRES
ncbi:MAG: hypothetical protein QOC81_3549 [Thermoanaerobaculia bacterium]|jgi:thymidylate kinase|nr:hypothetical protein [Thermoanaerobaculia bacterium]